MNFHTMHINLILKQFHINGNALKLNDLRANLKILNGQCTKYENLVWFRPRE